MRIQNRPRIRLRSVFLCCLAPLALTSCLSNLFFMETKEKPLAEPATSNGRVIGSPSKFKGYDFKAVDKRALQTPADAAASMRKLVAYLTADARNDLERTRALFIWEAANIAYDGSAFSVRDIPRLQPEEIFLRRKGVCGHYSVLFQRLATMAGLQVEAIGGKATGYPSSILLGDTSHCWNAIKIDGAWYLLDVTWSAGYLDNSFQFHKYPAPSEEFFLTEPSEFVKSHFPDDPLWQLLTPPIRESEFLDIAAKG